ERVPAGPAVQCRSGTPSPPSQVSADGQLPAERALDVRTKTVSVLGEAVVLADGEGDGDGSRPSQADIPRAIAYNASATSGRVWWRIGGRTDTRREQPTGVTRS